MSSSANQYVILGAYFKVDEFSKKLFDYHCNINGISEEEKEQLYQDDVVFNLLEAHTDYANKRDEGDCKDGIIVLYDGMNSKYVVVGEVLSKTFDDGDNGTDGDPKTFCLQGIYHKTFDVNKRIIKHFGIMSEKGIELITVTHYR